MPYEYENLLHIFSLNDVYARYLHISSLPVITSTKKNSSVYLQRCVNDIGLSRLAIQNFSFLVVIKLSIYYLIGSLFIFTAQKTHFLSSRFESKVFFYSVVSCISSEKQTSPTITRTSFYIVIIKGKNINFTVFMEFYFVKY